MKNKYAKQYLDRRCHLFPLYLPESNDEVDSRGRPLDGKTPAVSTWGVNVPVEDYQIEHSQNLGYAIGDGILVIDVDCKPGQPGLESWEALKELYPELKELEATVKTPSGGSHYYCQAPEGVKLSKKMRGFDGIDFLSLGMYCIIPGSITVKTEKTMAGKYTFDNLLGALEFQDEPFNLIKALAKPTKGDDDDSEEITKNIEAKGKSIAGTRLVDNLFGFTDLTSGKTPTKVRVKDEKTYSEEDVQDFLASVNPDCSYPEWRKIACAIHDWDPGIAGRKLFTHWSKRGSKFKETGIRGCKEMWEGISEAGSGMVTLGTLLHESRLGVVEELEVETEALLKTIKTTASIADLKTSVTRQIKKEISKFDVEQTSRIHEAYQTQFKKLSGSKKTISVADVRKILRPAKKSTQDLVKGIRERHPWTDEWVWVDADRKFASKERPVQCITPDTFRMIYTKDMPENERGGKADPIAMCKNNGLVDAVSHREYRPGEGQLFKNKESDNIPILNLWSQASIPKEAEEFSEEGLELISYFENHVERVLGSKEHADTLIQFLAHQVQFPGRKIKWCPVIQGAQGIGKSVLKEILQAAIGDANVNDIKADQVTGQFNRWAMGHVCGFIEELKIAGHERYSAVNSLKPIITERNIMIRDLGVSQYTVRNLMNFVIFTNHRDCIPATEIGRRFWVVMSPWKTFDDIAESAGCKDVNEYFDPLWRLVKVYGDELRKWFLEYEISEEFLNSYQAPWSNAREVMLQTEEADIIGLHEARGLLRQGGEFYNRDVLSSTHFFHDMETTYPDIHLPQGRNRNAILRRLGYSQVLVGLLDGKTCRIWANETNKVTEMADVKAMLLNRYEPDGELISAEPMFDPIEDLDDL
jgi:hypothetical protein